jgi:hypothetical protein
MEKVLRICLMCSKDEDWIIEKTLTLASLWADYIILVDQGSVDDTLKIASKFSKVTIVNNDATDFDEKYMRNLQLKEARKIEGKRLLIFVDADEALTPNYAESPEWNTIASAEPGTRIFMRAVNILPGFETYYTNDNYFEIGFMDDGVTEIEGKKVHSHRIPHPKDSKVICLNQIKFLHYALVNIMRAKSKIRWYMSYELLIMKKYAIEIYRLYAHFHHFDLLKHIFSIKPLPDEWLYKNEDATSFILKDSYTFDDKVQGYINQHGSNELRKLDIWYHPWRNAHGNLISSPRRFIDKVILRYVLFSQKNRRFWLYQNIDSFLKKCGY